MVGRNRWRAWIAPALLGTLLQGGCQTSGHNGGAAPIPMTTAPNAVEKTVQPTTPTDGGRAGAKEPDGGIIQASAQSTNGSETPRADDGVRPAAPGKLDPVAVAGKNDVHQRSTPTATGSLLNIAPGESLVERLTEMTAKLDSAESARKTLETRVQQLAAVQEQREKTLQQTTKEIHEASEEVQRTLALVQTLQQEMDEMRASLTRRDKDEIETLKAFNKLLERLGDEKKGPESEERTPRPK